MQADDVTQQEPPTEPVPDNLRYFRRAVAEPVLRRPTPAVLALVADLALQACEGED